jgi:hypothetical protein
MHTIYLVHTAEYGYETQGFTSADDATVFVIDQLGRLMPYRGILVTINRVDKGYAPALINAIQL